MPIGLHGNAARAEQRRAQWKGGRIPAAEGRVHDVAFWQQAPGGVRLDAILALAMEWYGTADPPAGLRRSAGGIRPR